MTKPLSAKVEVAGVRPATFKLVERGPDSYFLYRSSRKLGTAKVEPKGGWTARFNDPAGPVEGTASSGQEVGTYLLTQEAREEAARPLEETHPELRVKGRKTGAGEAQHRPDATCAGAAGGET